MAPANPSTFSPLSQGETSSEEKLLIVAPSSLRKKFLHMAHDAVGHQGTDKTIARLPDFTYWVGMAKHAGHYCSHCVICQKVKAPTRPPAPLQPIVTRKPWEMVGNIKMEYEPFLK